MLEQKTSIPNLMPGSKIDFLDGSARILRSSSSTSGAKIAVDMVSRRPLNTTGETERGSE